MWRHDPSPEEPEPLASPVELPLTGARYAPRQMVDIRFLEGLRVVESSLLEPASLGALLGELGADVVKVEPPGEGDYVRRMAWPIIDGVSILHWHCNRA